MGSANRARDELRERVLAGELTPMQAAEMAPRWGRFREPDGLAHDVTDAHASSSTDGGTGPRAYRSGSGEHVTVMHTDGPPAPRVGWGAQAAASYWPVSVEVLGDALDQARPFTGDITAEDKAWSARVQAAVEGMDALDQRAMDQWITTHATSSTPHLEEAGLVAAWETWLAREYTDEADAETSDQDDNQQADERAERTEHSEEAEEAVPSWNDVIRVDSSAEADLPELPPVEDRIIGLADDVDDVHDVDDGWP